MAPLADSLLIWLDDELLHVFDENALLVLLTRFFLFVANTTCAYTQASECSLLLVSAGLDDSLTVWVFASTPGVSRVCTRRLNVLALVNSLLA
jgi:hypothetical protein